MPKTKTFLTDTFEKLAEFGKSTAKKSVKSVVDTFNPLSVLEHQSQNDQSRQFSEATKKTENEKAKQPNHTPIDFDKLDKKYRAQDQSKTQSLRESFFRLARDNGERALYQERQNELRQKQQMTSEDKENQRKKEQRIRQMQQSNIPQGKIKQSIFAPRKKGVVKSEQAEMKPSVGKQ